MKLAIIDLDGVVANNDARFERARLADGRINWEIAFDQTLVPLDVPIPGAASALDFLETKGYEVFFLTSRPHYMREATIRWLRLYNFMRWDDLEGEDTHRGLIMKDYVADRFTKTTEWKKQRLADFATSGAVAEILFIDDEEVNRAAVESLGVGIVCKADLSDYMDSDKPLIF